MLNKYKVLVIICTVIFIILIGAIVFDKNIRVINISNYEGIKDDIEIIEEKNYIKFISNINMLKEIKWIDDNNIVFEEQNEKEKINKYKLDCLNKEMTELDSLEQDNQIFNNLKGNIKFVKKINNNEMLIYLENKEDKGLFILENNKRLVKLLGDVTYNDKLVFKVSSNNKKVVFYDKEENVIKVLNLQNKKIVKLDYEANKTLLENFNELLQFSYDAGYITISDVNMEDVSKSSFSVFGADSGKIYGDKIMGINTVWANNKLLISFTYVDKNTKLYIDEDNVYKAVGDRIGIFNLKTRKIKYTERVSNKEIISPLLWSKDDKYIYYLVKDTSKKEKNYELFCYDIIGKQLHVYENYFKDENLDSLPNLKVINDNIVVNGKIEDKSFLKIIDLQNRKTENIYGVQEFFTAYVENYSNIKVVYKFLNSGRFYYIINNSLYLYDNDSKYLLYCSRGTITHIIESPSKTKILVVSKVNEKYEFAVLNIVYDRNKNIAYCTDTIGDVFILPIFTIDTICNII